MPTLLSELFDRFWCRREMEAIGPTQPLVDVRRDYARGERIVAFARAASETDLDADDARVARALYAMAIDESARTTVPSPNPALPSAEAVESATTPTSRRQALEQCDAAYESVRAAQLRQLSPYRSVLIRRTAHVVLLGAVLYGGFAGVRHLARPELAGGKPWRSSSPAWGWPSEGAHFMGADTHREPNNPALLFHTAEENEPWLEIDFQVPTKVHSAEVVNRSDCCGDNAAPMVIEVSNDQKNWTSVARREEVFSTWDVSFATQTTRWIRFRIPRKSQLALEEVHVW